MSAEDRSTNDGDRAVVYKSAPLFHSIQAPVLKNIGAEAVRSFSLSRRKYESEVSERRTQPGGGDLQPRSLRLSIDPDLLESMLFLQVLGSHIE
jgi:hypothetical protein